MSRFMGESLAGESEFCQQQVECLGRRDAKAFVGRLGGSLEMTLVEFEHGIRRMFGGDRRGFQHLVIQGNGQLAFVQVGAQEDVKATPADHGLSGGRPLNWVEEGLGRQPDFD